jgi:hypothetical protein
MFENRKGHVVILKRKLGTDEYIVQSYTRASLQRLQDKIGKLYRKQEKKPRKAPQLDNSDDFTEQWKADNENNLIDLEK